MYNLNFDTKKILFCYNLYIMCNFCDINLHTISASATFATENLYVDKFYAKNLLIQTIGIIFAL